MDFLKLMEDWNGYSVLSERAKPENYEAQLKETIDLLTNANGLPAHRRTYLLQEALTTSNFPLLFGDVLDRQILTAYRAVDPVWKAIVRIKTVNRLYPLIGGYRFAITGGDQYLQEVPEKGEYQASERKEAQYPVYCRKYGRQFDISWETLLADTLGALKDTPERFAKAATRTEHRLVTGTYADDVGTHAAGNLYENGVNEDVLALTIPNLEICLQRMSAFTDANGEPIMNRAKTLVVGPANEMNARQILTSAQKMWAEGTGATPTPWPTTNVIPQMGLVLVVDPYLPVMHADAPGSWFLFADPADIAAIEVDYLEGHERPEICMKASDKVALGGGPINPMEGDFATDNIVYRVRECFGANKLDWRATYGNIHA